MFLYLKFFYKKWEARSENHGTLIAAFCEEFMGISASMATLATSVEEKEKCKLINFKLFKPSLGLINFS